MKKLKSIEKKLPKQKLDVHATDNPRIVQLKQNMVNIAERVKKEGIK